MRKVKSVAFIRGINMKTEDIINGLSKALLNWYNFKADTRALFLSGGFPECEVLFEVLEEKNLRVDKCCLSEIEDMMGKYEYIVMAGIIEKSTNPIQLLTKLKCLLTHTGRILIAADNRFAMRYFCGDKDMFSGHVLDGIDNYRRVSAKRMDEIGGHSYSRAELSQMLEEVKLLGFQFFSVMPSVIRPQILLKYGYTPNERLDIRVFPQYKSPETIYLEEELLYESLLGNDMFHQMANGYFIECSMDGQLTDANQITIQGDRSPKEAFATILQNDKVSKRPLYQEGNYKVQLLMRNTEYLEKHQIPMVSAEVKDNTYIMPYVQGQIATEYFRDTLRKNRIEFLCKLEEFRAIILQSSEHVPYEEVDWRKFEPGWEKRKADDPNIDKWEKLAFGSEMDRENIGIILEKGFIDMASLNCFYTDEGFKFFDQEFYIEQFPANAIFIRTIDFIYRDSYEMEQLYPREELLRYFHLYEHQNVWRRKGNVFLEALRNEKELCTYHKHTRRDYRSVVSNRFRMDYPQEEYDRLFSNIFKGINNKRIYLFGSGKYSEKFIEQFGQYYNIAGILDNNCEKWGTKLERIEIYSPQILNSVEVPYKVFVCIKYFENVLIQLKDMGVRNISIYDPRLDYERPMQIICKKEIDTPKKYHIGYVAGVFDLFHIGHLNIFKRAKEQCDYLIVGVVSDEQVINDKKTCPYIPFEERLEIVQSCRYVDEAVKIPVDRPNTEDAWYMYHFDVQFSGSDYENDPAWLAKKVFLQQHGSDLVFFPYTETTSSTEIKAQIRKAQALEVKKK